MTDHSDLPDDLRPPSGRQAPESLRRRVTEAIEAEPTRGRSVARVLAPVAAATVLLGGVVGAYQLGADNTQPRPADTPSPATPSETASPSAPKSTSTEPAAQSGDVRPINDADAKKLAQKCVSAWDKQQQERGGSAEHAGEWTVRYAVVKKDLTPGENGKEYSYLVLTDDVAMLDCTDGKPGGWGRDPEALDGKPKGNAQGLEETGLTLGASSQCSDEPGPDDVYAAETAFTVSDRVATVRSRLVLDGRAGPWITTEPNRGVAVAHLKATGEDAWAAKYSLETQLLDRDGKELPIEWYADGDAERHRKQDATTAVESVPGGCQASKERREGFENPKKFERPANDGAGEERCRALLGDAFDGEDFGNAADWKARSIISTDDRWSAVLSNGEQMIGCSLFPTQEVSPPMADQPTTTAESFYFALQPTPDMRKSTLWAAGRVPDDVSKITYALPNGKSVDATITEGYWMVHYVGTMSNDEIGADPSAWPPLKVTVVQGGQSTTHEIQFTTETSCDQSSHGC
ncbi:hypothetical protein ACQBAR_11060 [Propionibacteriaceae bacterium Y1685]|uniref:hypothetical protein n=1 Tax=Microlunatus sp. Y1700 TaxID=3418487 RepID=UPI003B823C37